MNDYMALALCVSISIGVVVIGLALEKIADAISKHKG